MNPTPNNFADRLLLADTSQTSKDRQEKFEKEISAMLEQKLSTTQRAVAYYGAGMMMFFAIVSAIVLRRHPIPALAASGIVCALFALVQFSTAWRGVINRKQQSQLMAGMGFAFFVAMTIIFERAAATSDNPILATQLIFGAEVFLAMGAGLLLISWIEQRELSARQKMLELESRLLDISEKLDRLAPPPQV